ncbi:MAG: phospho-N-acetylmuramoyl-pentapeptide-transferase [Actinobacteria bacterium]|nr:phospho-N-acetylmuramoyl-pentapeptide-transferase [Actinomycetota bacterium]
MIALVLAGAVSFSFSVVGTRLLIGWLRANHVGQPIRSDGPQQHLSKAGTPTIGGVAIVGAATLGYLTAHVRPGLVFTRSGLFVMFLIVAAGGVGLVDDWIKVKNERNLGLSKSAKFGGLFAVAICFTLLTLNLSKPHLELSFTRYNSINWTMPAWLWVIWALLLLLGTTNAVNLTDGLDGLASGAAIQAFICYTVICFWAFRYPMYDVPHALDLAVVAVSMAASLAGFLWWNAAPAKIFMGDTGALAIGAGLAGLALLSNTQLLLPIIGGLFVYETVSVILQVASFRLFGRRIFLMAPVHHHYEHKGWDETTVVVRFWIIAGMCTVVALGIFYADFIHLGLAR